MPKKQRILLKLSGEFLQGKQEHGLCPSVLSRIAKEIKDISAKYEICIVIGGGNFCRGASSKKADRVLADYHGMEATLKNCKALKKELRKNKVSSFLFNALAKNKLSEPNMKTKVLNKIAKGNVVLFGGGTGIPFFTTDTTAAVRACEMECDLVLKATNVDGVYSSDPDKNKKAKRFDKMTYHDVLSHELKVMDLSAITLLKENKTPLKVFSLEKKGNLKKVLNDKGLFTLVK